MIGAGLVGAAIAFGLAEIGAKVFVLDEGDVALRASSGNFGLVWVQGKGAQMPPYADWTRASADQWPQFAERLSDETGRDVGYRKPGGLHLCLSEEAFEARADLVHRMHNSPGAGGADCTMLSAQETRELLPDIGEGVFGASHCVHDGHVSPLRLLRSLQEGIVRRSGKILSGHKVTELRGEGGAFKIVAGGEVFSGGKVVLAAGLANAWLGPMVGLNVPVEPLKGQILVTARAAPRMPYPTTHVRQTEEGHYLLGDSKEDAGFDVSSSTAIIGDIAQRAVRAFPYLGDANVVRTWAALRIMTPDSCPIYEESKAFPGAFVATCHSGVTLAAQHATTLPRLIADGGFGDALGAFSGQRFANATT